MCAIVKTVIRFGVIAGLATGAAVLVAGPQRVAAAAGQARSKILSTIDSNLENPVVLRSQLRELAETYPDRIREVRGDLAELDEQIAQIDRDRVVAQRVVELAGADLDQLNSQLERAKAARAEHPGARTVVISVKNEDLKIDEAFDRATQIAQTRAAYQSRVADADRTLAFLTQQSGRLSEMLTKLEEEHSDLQTQLWQLDHQIDAIERNDKLLAMLEQRERELNSHDWPEVASLDQLRQRLASIRAEQESQFKSLERSSQRESYEDVARQQLDREADAQREFESTMDYLRGATPSAQPDVRIEPEGEPKAIDSGPVVRIH